MFAALGSFGCFFFAGEFEAAFAFRRQPSIRGPRGDAAHRRRGGARVDRLRAVRAGRFRAVFAVVVAARFAYGRGAVFTDSPASASARGRRVSAPASWSCGCPCPHGALGTAWRRVLERGGSWRTRTCGGCARGVPRRAAARHPHASRTRSSASDRRTRRGGACEFGRVSPSVLRSGPHPSSRPLRRRTGEWPNGRTAGGPGAPAMVRARVRRVLSGGDGGSVPAPGAGLSRSAVRRSTPGGRTLPGRTNVPSEARRSFVCSSRPGGASPCP